MTTNGTAGVLVSEDWGFVTGMCPAMQTLEGVVSEIAPTNIPVLFLGESGTGKAMFAQRLHRLSARCEEPVVTVSCAAMDPAQLSAELRMGAGHSKNSSLGAAGSVIFDEISELDSTCQRNLLYALPDGHADSQRGVLGARVISTTRRNLDDEMRAGRFRAELYYRINGVCLRLPALRERREDIPALVDHFVRKFSLAMNKRITRVSPTAMNQLQQQSWLGNVRELENSVERAMVVGQEPELHEGDFAFKSQSASASNGSSKTLEDIERAHILKVVGECAGNQSHAADVLDIDRVTLYHKLKKYGWSRSDKKPETPKTDEVAR